MSFSLSFLHRHLSKLPTSPKHPCKQASSTPSHHPVQRRNVSFTVSSGQKEDFFKACQQAATRLSFTRMQDYKSCPLKFRYKYLEKKFTPMNEHVVRGSALHEAIAVFGRWYVNRDLENPSNNPPEKDIVFPQEMLLKLKEKDIQQLGEKQMKVLMFRVYKEVWRRSMPALTFPGTKEELQAFYEKGKRMLWKFFIRETTMMHRTSGEAPDGDGEEDHVTDFDEVYGFDSPNLQQRDSETPLVDTTIRRPHMVEQRFSFDVVSPNRTIKVTGIFDRIDKAFSRDMGLNNNVIVVEYKTSIKEYAKENHRNQVKLYTYAYQRVHGVRPSRGMIYSISDDNFFVYEPRARDANDVEKIVVRISDSIANGYFRPKPDFSKCKFCDFRAICPSSAYQRDPNLSTDIEEYIEQEEQQQQREAKSAAPETPISLARGASLPLLQRKRTVASGVAVGAIPIQQQPLPDESDLEDEDENPAMLKVNTGTSRSSRQNVSRANTSPAAEKQTADFADEEEMSDDDDDAVLLPQKKVNAMASAGKAGAIGKRQPVVARDDEWDEDSDEEL